MNVSGITKITLECGSLIKPPVLFISGAAYFVEDIVAKRRYPGIFLRFLLKSLYRLARISLVY